MFCCLGRKKRDSNEMEKKTSKKEMVERFILQNCKSNDEVLYHFDLRIPLMNL